MYHLQASAYAKCVAVKENVTKDVYVKEFMALKECFTIAVSIKFIRLLLTRFSVDVLWVADLSQRLQIYGLFRHSLNGTEKNGLLYIMLNTSHCN